MSETISHYRVVRKLGAGAMGEVFLAEDTRLKRLVALKLLSDELARDPEQRRRFIREARTASALSHPNVCTIHEIGEREDGRPFLAMEYVEGDTLEARVADGPLEAREVADIASQIADALDAARSAGIVHRDIKPANIHVQRQGRVKVLDFGLAKVVTDSARRGGDIVTTRAGTVLGTPAFMSPEQAAGRPLDHRSDLFSLGVVVYELLTGRLPFAGGSVAEVLHKIVHVQPEAIARFNYDVPPELERITLKLLAKNPERRYQSARDVVVDLRNLGTTLDRLSESEHRPDPSTSLLDAPGELASLETCVGGGVAFERASDPGKLSDSDVLISFASLDDQPIVAGQEGWISRFHRNLELRVAQLSGKEVAVLKQPDPSVVAELEAKVLENVPAVKTVVSVLSPPFVRSNGCRRLVRTFWKSAEDSGRLEVGNHSRILNVVKTPVEHVELPDDIRPLFSRLVPFEFFERDPRTGRLREFDETFGESARQRFYERVYDVAFEVSQVLKHMGDHPGNGGERTADSKTIYLATTTSDLEPHRDQLRRELTELGHVVLPRQPLPLVASELETVVRGCLERCDLAIHFVGEHYGFVPEATELSVVALQNRVAAEHSESAGLERIVWVPRGVSPRDERQVSFIRELEGEPSLLRGAELIVDTLENLKVLLRTRARRRAASEPARGTGGAREGPLRLYLICDRGDEPAIEPLEDFFYEKGIEVSLPGFDASESEIQEVHIRNLRDCDAVLIFYGSAGMHWVDFNIRDLQKAAGYRDSVPIPVTAVYLAPPFHRRKERFRSISIDVIRQQGDAFDPAPLGPFVGALGGTRGVGE